MQRTIIHLSHILYEKSVLVNINEQQKAQDCENYIKFGDKKLGMRAHLCSS